MNTVAAGEKKREYRSSIATGLVAIGLFLFAASTWIPWRPSYPQNDLDGSWAMALQDSFEHHWDFGQRYAFTYGPWGIIYAGYNHATYTRVVLVWTALAGLFLAGLWTIARRFTSRLWLLALFVLGVFSLTGSMVLQVTDVRLFSFCWLLLVIHFYVRHGDRVAVREAPVAHESFSLRTWIAASENRLLVLEAALTIATAWLSFVKFSNFLLSIAIIALICVHDAAKYRRFPTLAAVYLMTLPVAWIAAGQPIGSLPAFFRHSTWIASGYSAAMSIDLPTETHDVLFFLSTTGLMLVGVVIIDWRIGGFARLAPVAGLVAVLLLIFKAGYVRHDRHEITAAVGLPVIILLYLAGTWSCVSSKVGKTLLFTALLPALFQASSIFERYTRAGLASQLWQTVIDIRDNSVNAGLWLVGQSKLDQSYEAELAQIATKYPLPASTRTTDLYPWNQSALLAHHLPRSARPVMGSYSAYSAELSKLNADFLRGAGAPDTIFFDVMTIDGRYPSLDDAQSWPELLCRYDITALGPGYLALRRASSPRHYTIVDQPEVRRPLSEWTPVAATGDLVWAKIDVRLTTAGKLLQQIYKAPRLALKVRTRNGLEGNFRLIPEVSKAGFLLSPLIMDRYGFASLQSSTARQQLEGFEVTALTVAVANDSGTSSSYESSYSVSLSRLNLDSVNAPALPGLEEFVRLSELLKGARVLKSDGPIQLGVVADGLPAILVPQNAQLMFPATPGSRHVRLTFGVRSTQASPPSSGAVLFRLYGVAPSPNGLQGQVIWSQQVDYDPAFSAGKSRSAVVEWGSPTPPLLLIETVALPGISSIGGFWADVDMR